MSAGLPNITGKTSSYAVQSGSGSGALTSKVIKDAKLWGSNTTHIASLSLDASNSNDIYDNSSTVTPESLSTKFFIKY